MGKLGCFHFFFFNLKNLKVELVIVPSTKYSRTSGLSAKFRGFMISGNECSEHSEQISDPRQEKNKTKQNPNTYHRAIVVCVQILLFSKVEMSVDIHSPQPPNCYTTIAILSIQICKVLKE